MRERILWCAILVLGGALCLGADISPTAEPLRQAHPGVRFFHSGSQLTRVYGTPFGSGVSAQQSAQQFVDTYSGIFGVAPDELEPGNTFNDRLAQPVMLERATGQCKFTLVYYRQARDGVPVYDGELRCLVRNTPEHSLVWAGSSLRALGRFAVPPGARALTAVDAAHAAAAAHDSALRDFSAAEAVIWAGMEDEPASPRLAMTFIAAGATQVGAPRKWRFVCDAATGDILHAEDLIVFDDISGSVRGMATVGSKADFCSPETAQPLPWARVDSTAGQTAFADAAGHFTLPNAGTAPLTVNSYMDGLYFYVQNYLADVETLALTVTPPGPADFLHNAANDDEFVRAQVNAYVQTNSARAWVLTRNPAYPIIADEHNFPVWVNRTDSYCPGNAWYDGSSLNFCAAGGIYANTAWQSVICHEYGHHVISSGGSGQAAYGEGMADCQSMLKVDQPIVGYGFRGDCDAGIRTGDNSLQYPCYGEIHACGQLISGCVWSTRNELAVTEPQQYLTILSDLTINSILLHHGELIQPSISIDFLTLDDDDGNLDNGTPHYGEITRGFGAHNMWGNTPQITLPVSLLAQWGGASYAVTVAGGLAFLSTGTSLVTLDISQPADPRAIGQIALPDVVHGVVVQSGRAYVADSGAGLQILDVSNPAQPHRLGVFATTNARDVVVSGNFAYVADNYGGLVVVDVSNPSAPFEEGRCSTYADALGLTLDGHYLYVSEQHYGLQIIDVSNPAAPTPVGARPAGAGVTGAAVVAPYAYLSERNWGLEIVNVSNPAAPLFLSRCDTSGTSLDIAVAGNRAYIADADSGLQIIDITNPNAAHVQTHYDTVGRASNVVLSGDLAFVADDVGGLQIINVADPNNPVGEGRYVHAGTAEALVVAGRYAYVANGAAGLQITDIANPSVPVCLSTYAVDGTCTGIALAGHYAYLATGIAGVQVFDVANPAAPLKVGGLPTPGTAWNLTLAGGYAYVAADDAGLQIIDVSNPALPQPLGTYDTPGHTLAVAVAGHWAYLADDTGGLQVVDVSDPNAPVAAGSFDTPAPASGLAVSNGLAYVADGFAGLQIISVADPPNFAFVGQVPLPGEASGVTLDRSYAYVATGDAGVQVIDVSDPVRARWIGQYDTPGFAAATASAGYLFVADGSAGVAVLRIGRAGDLDGDGRVGFSDINPFVARLASPAAYFAAFPACPVMNGDINGDGTVDFADINPFVDCIIHGGCP